MNKGFSLIEIMVVVAIIAIIAAVAYPSYTNSVRKAKREDAKTMLMEIAGQQQRYYTNNNEFANALTALGYGGSLTSNDGYYAISMSSNSSGGRVVGYTLTATPVAGKSQEVDKCGSFTLDSKGVEGVSGGSLNADDCW